MRAVSPEPLLFAYALAALSHDEADIICFSGEREIIKK